MNDGSIKKTASTVRKYVIYLSGEILLIVVGILIALQINNWNEVQKDKVVENELLASLKSELIILIDALNSCLEKNENSLEAAKKYISETGKNITDSQKVSIVLSASNYVDCEFSNPILEKINSSGREYKIIKNDLLLDMFRLQENIKKNDRGLFYLDEFFNQSLAPFLVSNHYMAAMTKALGSQDFSIERLLTLYDDPLYQSHMSMKMILHGNFVQQQRIILRDAKAILAKIED